MKKIILTIFLLAFSFTLNYGQTNVIAPSGTGTEADPYQIGSLENLSWLTQNDSLWGVYYIQTSDIDASETATWDDSDDNADGDLYNDANDRTTDGNNEGWSPIGNETKLFSGVYDGGGFIIDGLNSNRPAENHVALFGYVRGDFEANSYIKNLGLTNATIIGNGYVGCFVGENNSASIANCYATGTVSSTSDVGYVGGFVGYNREGALIEKCYSEVDVDVISNGTSSGDAHIGGFVGRNRNKNATIKECYSTGNVTTTGNIRRVGGFAGQSAYAKISNCYSTGIVNYQGLRDDPQAAAFCGRSFSDTLEYCYSVGQFIAESLADAHTRGFIGSNNSNNVYVNNFMDTVASGCNGSRINDAVTGKNTSEMQTEETYTDWDFISTWAISGTNYPVLQALYDDPDKDAPTPNPMTFAVAPSATSHSSVTMTATEASDTNGVEYYFECVTTGNNSGWQDSLVFNDTGLRGGTEYSYRVKARDKSANKNETAYSAEVSVTTEDAPPLLFIEKDGICTMEAEHAVVSQNGDLTSDGLPFEWNFDDTTETGYAGSGYMTTKDDVALNATWDNGTELAWEVEITTEGEYFVAARRIALDGGDDSAWLGLDGTEKGKVFLDAVANFTWKHAEVSLGTLSVGKHTIQLRRREDGLMIDRLMIATSVDKLLEDGSTEIGPAESIPGAEVPAPFFIEAPNVVGDGTSISMTASDSSGRILEYYFECITDKNHSSGWQTSPTYLDSNLVGGTEYTYRVKGIDINKYQSEYSEEASATTEGEEPNVYIEVDGSCVMEAENAIVLQNGDSTGYGSPYTGSMEWYKDSTIVGFAGTGYMTTENGVSLNASWDTATELFWVVNIANGGEYFIAIRRHNNGEANSETAKPGVDGNEKAYSAFWGEVTEFTWVHGPSLGILWAGEHTIQIRRREDGLMIDRVMIAKSLDSFPADGSTEVGPAENPITSIDKENELSGMPTAYALEQNYPNPFNPTTVIRFALPKQSVVKLSVYNVIGEKITELVNGNMSAGYHEVNFNATNLATGMYIYRISAGNFVSVKKMLLIK